MLDKEKYSVIIVDDDKDVCEIFRRRLSAWYDVISFQTAQDLLDNIDQLNPSLFVLDWLFPEMDGIELCKKIREQHKFDLVPIAFYTGVEPKNKNIKKAFEAGAETFISKTQSSYLLFLNVRTLVESYFRMLEYLQQRKVMLSVLKHDMANYATCLTTGVEVLSMNKAFKETGMQEQIKPILSSSRKLSFIFEDLKEVLITDNRDFNKIVTVVQTNKIFDELKSYLEGLQRKVMYRDVMVGEICCDYYRFCRCLYYIVRFIDKNIPEHLSVDIDVVIQENTPVFRASVKGCFKKIFEDVILSGPIDNDPDSQHDFLFVNYIENVLSWHKTRMLIDEDQESTGVMFVLPKKDA